MSLNKFGFFADNSFKGSGSDPQPYVNASISATNANVLTMTVDTNYANNTTLSYTIYDSGNTEFVDGTTSNFTVDANGNASVSIQLSNPYQDNRGNTNITLSVNPPGSNSNLAVTNSAELRRVHQRQITFKALGNAILGAFANVVPVDDWCDGQSGHLEPSEFRGTQYYRISSNTTQYYGVVDKTDPWVNKSNVPVFVEVVGTGQGGYFHGGAPGQSINNGGGGGFRNFRVGTAGQNSALPGNPLWGHYPNLWMNDLETKFYLCSTGPGSNSPSGGANASFSWRDGAGVNQTTTALAGRFFKDEWADITFGGSQYFDPATAQTVANNIDLYGAGGTNNVAMGNWTVSSAQTLAIGGTVTDSDSNSSISLSRTGSGPSIVDTITVQRPWGRDPIGTFPYNDTAVNASITYGFFGAKTGTGVPASFGNIYLRGGTGAVTANLSFGVTQNLVVNDPSAIEGTVYGGTINPGEGGPGGAGGGNVDDPASYGGSGGGAVLISYPSDGEDYLVFMP